MIFMKTNRIATILIVQISLFLFGKAFAQTATPATPAFTAQSATFSVTVSSGTPPFNYLWKKDGVTLPSQTTASFTIPSLSLADAGTYTVTVSNSAGSAGAMAQLTVAQLIVIPAGATLTITAK